MTAPRLRQAVRALMIDPEDRVLLIKLDFSDWSGWVLPGGGVETGEDHEAALRRELAEETGVPDVFIGPPVWRRRHVMPGIAKGYDGQEETVYLVPCRRFDVSPGLTEEQLRTEGMVEHRWWTVDGLATTSDAIRPENLHELAAQILEHGAPDDPPVMEEVGCLICRKHGRGASLPGGVIYEDELIHVGHILPLSDDERTHGVYPGYLMLEPKRHVSGMGRLTDDEAARLGVMINRASRALRDLEGAEHVYSFIFGDSVDHLHVHLNPRYPGTPPEFWGAKLRRWPGGPRADLDGVAEICDRIRAALAD